MLAHVANLGCEMAQIGIASPEEIDLAMRLGLNYPLGPLQRAEELGLPNLLALLTTLQAITGDDRYRPSAWLRRRARVRTEVGDQAGDVENRLPALVRAHRSVTFLDPPANDPLGDVICAIKSLAVRATPFLVQGDP